MTRQFTGTHMLAICIAFFGVVIAVNVLMAVEATRTFSGTVVENSYVASQHFNRWLDEARAEDRLGWRAELRREPDGHVLLFLAGQDGALSADSVTAVAEHPLGGRTNVPLRFMADGQGRYHSTEPLPAGRWRLKIDAHAGQDRVRLIRDMPA